jgi:hypothetical protein
MKMDKMGLIGIILILLGLVVYATSPLDQIIMIITWPLLSGSSEGKAVLLLVLMGSLLLLNTLIIHSRLLEPWEQRIFKYSPDGKKFLKWALFLILATYIVGLLIEFIIRAKYGVSFLTIFVSLNPNPTTTSPMHSHVFKAVLGHLAGSWGGLIPSHIHTGNSLYRQVVPWAYSILITFPLAYIAGLFSIDRRRDVFKVIMVFVLSLTLIGMVDGGMFSQPAVIGLAGLFILYFINEPFKARQLILPIVLILLLVLSGLGLELAGNNSSYHELTIINQTEPVDLSGYQVLSMEKQQNMTIVRIKTQGSDKSTLESLFSTYGGKAEGFFMSWNFFSYF